MNISIRQKWSDYLILVPNLENLVMHGALYPLASWGLLNSDESRYDNNSYAGENCVCILNHFVMHQWAIWPIKRCYVDHGYRGHGVEDTDVIISGRKRGMTPQMKKEMKRRNVIEPVIGHMKSDGKLDRNYLSGLLGDKINVLLCGAGFNIRIIPRKLRKELSFFLLVFAVLSKYKSNWRFLSDWMAPAYRWK